MFVPGNHHVRHAVAFTCGAGPGGPVWGADCETGGPGGLIGCCVGVLSGGTGSLGSLVGGAPYNCGVPLVYF